LSDMRRSVCAKGKWRWTQSGPKPYLPKSPAKQGIYREDLCFTLNFVKSEHLAPWKSYIFYQFP